MAEKIPRSLLRKAADNVKMKKKKLDDKTIIFEVEPKPLPGTRSAISESDIIEYVKDRRSKE